MPDRITVKVDFEVETERGLYRDALTIPIEDWPWSEEQIVAAKQARVDNWLAIMTTPPADEPQDGEG